MTITTKQKHQTTSLKTSTKTVWRTDDEQPWLCKYDANDF